MCRRLSVDVTCAEHYVALWARGRKLQNIFLKIAAMFGVGGKSSVI